MKKVMVFGTYDLLHPGHAFFINQAREMGDKLIVIIGRDQNVKKIKGQMPVWDEQKRRDELRKAFPDPAISILLGDLEDFYVPVRKYQPDIIALGYDQRADEKKIRDVMKEWTSSPEIVRIEGFRTEEFKSSIMRNSHMP